MKNAICLKTKGQLKGARERIYENGYQRKPQVVVESASFPFQLRFMGRLLIIKPSLKHLDLDLNPELSLIYILTRDLLFHCGFNDIKILHTQERSS